MRTTKPSDYSYKLIRVRPTPLRTTTTVSIEWGQFMLWAKRAGGQRELCALVRDQADIIRLATPHLPKGRLSKLVRAAVHAVLKEQVPEPA